MIFIPKNDIRVLVVDDAGPQVIPYSWDEWKLIKEFILHGANHLDSERNPGVRSYFDSTCTAQGWDIKSGVKPKVYIVGRANDQDGDVPDYIVRDAEAAASDWLEV